ncbi:hypothetical protein BpHYR1_039387 [Brachionus plicatilis]|uniref:Uncharacterized protein n=1 Tax=Brachionus plicatilis TaxID=10195 RepID=A0A3M7SUM1_BRAPC|nr:hypothetical protein BpHYR1_039387 [Brachionus plicatilis]
MYSSKTDLLSTILSFKKASLKLTWIKNTPNILILTRNSLSNEKHEHKSRQESIDLNILVTGKFILQTEWLELDCILEN